jgi:hypothetical protein
MYVWEEGSIHLRDWGNSWWRETKRSIPWKAPKKTWNRGKFLAENKTHGRWMTINDWEFIQARSILGERKTMELYQVRKVEEWYSEMIN